MESALYDLQRQTELSLNDEGLSAADFQNLKEQFRKIKEHINSKKSEATHPKRRSDKSPVRFAHTGTLLERLTADPSLVEPDMIYSLNSPGGKPVSVVFHKRIVNEFFKNSNPATQKVARKILESLEKRSQGNFSGIKIMSVMNRGHSSNRVFVLHIGGKGYLDNLQIGGFIYEGTLYLTYSDKRGSRENNSFLNKLHKALAAFQGGESNSDGNRNRTSPKKRK